jgi:hypothetical protein
MSLHHGAFKEGEAAGYLNGESAENPYRKYINLRMSQNLDTDSIFYDMANDWESGKIQGRGKLLREMESAP